MARPFYTPENYDWRSSLGHRIGHLRCGLKRNLEQELAPHGLSAQQWIVLMMAASEKDLTAADIAKRLDYDPGAMTRILDRMQKKGLIRRVRAATDRRRFHLQLANKGRQLAPLLERAGINVLNRALEGFSPQEFKQLNTLLVRMIDNVK